MIQKPPHSGNAPVSFKRSVYSADRWDLRLTSHPEEKNGLVILVSYVKKKRGIERVTPSLPVLYILIRPQS